MSNLVFTYKINTFDLNYDNLYCHTFYLTRTTYKKIILTFILLKLYFHFSQIISGMLFLHTTEAMAYQAARSSA